MTIQDLQRESLAILDRALKGLRRAAVVPPPVKLPVGPLPRAA